MSVRGASRPSARPLAGELPGLKKAVVRAPSECFVLTVPGRDSVHLETPRLSLRPFETTDAAEFWLAAESSRRELERWLPWTAFVHEPSSAYRYAQVSEGDWDDARACRFTIRLRENQKMIGIVSFEQLSHLNLSLDLGYWLRTDETGRGLMREACARAIDWAFNDLSAHRVRACAAVDNSASRNVLRALGFRHEGIARHAEWCHGRFLDHAIHGLLGTDSRVAPAAGSDDV